MALSGAHIVCCYIAGRGKGDSLVEVHGEPIWSQTMASAGTTTNSAPKPTEENGQAYFYVRSDADIYIAIGASPDASASPRYFVGASDQLPYFAAKEGDKLAWVTA